MVFMLNLVMLNVMVRVRFRFRFGYGFVWFFDCVIYGCRCKGQCSVGE